MPPKRRLSRSDLPKENSKFKADVSQDTLQFYHSKRTKCADSVSHFPFNKSRVKILSDKNDIRSGNSCVLYWMNRDQRIQDNWALLFAQRLALKYKLQLKVCFCLVYPYLSYSKRHYDFMINGLECVFNELIALNIPMSILCGNPCESLIKFVKNNNVSSIVTDFLPIDPTKTWVETVRQSIPDDVSFSMVDTHNIVPCWIASNKKEYAARTFRPKIHSNLSDYLTEFPPVIHHDLNSSNDVQGCSFIKSSLFDFVSKAAEVEVLSWLIPGPTSGLVALEDFVNKRLSTFADNRNDAFNNMTSNLSPWFHFEGHLSTQRAVLRVTDYLKTFKHHVDIFVEESVVRRELSDNFCYYSKNPTSPDSAPDWARKTLIKHLNDKRPYLYCRDKFENGETHDPIWNAAQNQMKRTGKMSGYLRMYWAKKILEWSETPQAAFDISLYLNDKYSIDGNDPNGIVGCMWSVYGLHDRPWKEREIFGMIRYMNEVGCKRHFNTNAFISKYNE